MTGGTMAVGWIATATFCADNNYSENCSYNGIVMHLSIKSPSTPCLGFTIIIVGDLTFIPNQGGGEF